MRNEIEIFDRGILFEYLDRREAGCVGGYRVDVLWTNQALAARLQCLGGLMGEW